MLRTRWNNVEIKLCQRCFNVVSTSKTDVVSTLRIVENTTSDFVSFSTSDQRCFNVYPQRWNNVDQTLRYWLGKVYYFQETRSFCLKNWKLWPAPTTIEFNIFCWNFARIFCLKTSTAVCSGFFLFGLDLELLIKCKKWVCRNQFFLIFANSSRSTQN